MQYLKRESNNGVSLKVKIICYHLVSYNTEQSKYCRKSALKKMREYQILR